MSRWRNFKKKFRKETREINPEDIFIDSANLPDLNLDRLEGKLEKPIETRAFLFLKITLCLVFIFLSGRLWSLQIGQGGVYAKISEENRLTRSIIFADRGVIFDRENFPLALNDLKPGEEDFAARIYPDLEGLSALVGYVKYPSKDSKGIYYDEDYHGQAGVEKSYNSVIAGKNGSKLTETDALGKATSESIVDSPVKGEDIVLSVDSKLTQKLFQTISSVAHERGFTGGSGIIMDVNTGEILALTSYPEYNQNVVTDGSDAKEIARLLTSKGKPFLNRAVSGLYTPGSIVKPVVALGALAESVIDEKKQILSTGQISIPNPYNPEKPTIFRDWKAHGWVDMIDALAVSSDVYFYEVGGGYETQKGLGIVNLDKYFSLFGMNEKTNIDLPGESQGVIATPEWKKENFPEDPDWRVGNTYHTAIGQYGTQITPIEAVRYIGAIANGGQLLVPRVLKLKEDEMPRMTRNINLNEKFYKIVKEGMRQSAIRGTGSGLSVPGVKVAVKTGTAELGIRKEEVNSWVTGFFPYENPRYAFVIIMERGPVTNTIGGAFVMRQVFEWMLENTPEYLK